MKDEIKEILEELENMYEISELEEQVNNINKIRDYITNLQQENERLKAQVNLLDDKIDKAIEFIENPRHEMSVLTYQNLSNILQNGGK